MHLVGARDLAPSDDNQAEMVFEGHPCSSKLGLGDQHIYIYELAYLLNIDKEHDIFDHVSF